MRSEADALRCWPRRRAILSKPPPRLLPRPDRLRGEERDRRNDGEQQGQQNQREGTALSATSSSMMSDLQIHHLADGEEADEIEDDEEREAGNEPRVVRNVEEEARS